MTPTSGAALILAVVVLLMITAAVCASKCGTPEETTAPCQVRLSSQQHSDPVDVVFTWCKHEPTWAEEKKKHVRPTTTKECGARNPLQCEGPGDCEIHYAVKSVQRFMPWVRTIWILTQRPQDPQIPGTRVVFHDEVVKEDDVLPTFNSHAIETFIHHIPGLAEKFIYFNDDFFVGKPVTKHLFFAEDGRPIFYNTGKYINSFLALSPLSKYGFRHAWRNLYDLFRVAFGYSVRLPLHQAAAMSKSVCAASEHDFPDVWAAVRRTRLRSTLDLPPIGFLLNYGVMNGTVVARNANAIDTMFVQRNVKRNMKRLLHKQPSLFCINTIPDLKTWTTVKKTLDALFREQPTSVSKCGNARLALHQLQQGDPVDVVFTWCKHDLQWAQEKEKHVLPTTTTESKARNPLQCDGPDDCEIHYAVKSVQQFMPWVRTIWILAQRPQDPQIPGTRVVFHDQVVQDLDVLPTFNSHAIESFIHKIPGLAEKFIYFNDDCFVGKSVSKDLFFAADGRPIFYTVGEYAQSTLAKRPLGNFGYRHAWRNLANLFQTMFGYSVHLQLHEAQPLSKSVCAAAEAAFPDIWSAIRRTRLRGMLDVPPVGFLLNYAAMSGAVVVKDAAAIDTIEVHRGVESKMHDILKRRPSLFCVNNVPNQKTWAAVKKTLHEMFRD
jgi:hypothetical protein